MKHETITVIIKRPDEKVGHIEEIENTLEAMQRVVGGYIETVTFATDCAIVCNEEGRIYHLPANCSLIGIDFVGTIMVVGVDGDDFTDCPLSLRTWKEWIRNVG